MTKRWAALLTVCAILFSLCACSASGGLKKVLTTGSWTADGRICLRFYQDGTGVQYQEYEGETRTKSYLRWELFGRTLRILLTDDLDDYDLDEYEDYVESYEITEYSKYTMTLREENGWTEELRRTSLDD
mgnify:FL=1